VQGGVDMYFLPPPGPLLTKEGGDEQASINTIYGEGKYKINGF